MPVFDQGYQPLDVRPIPRVVRWWPIFTQVVIPQLKRRLVLMMLAMACGKLSVYALLTVLKLKLSHTPLAAMVPSLDSLGVVQFITGDGFGGQWIWVAIFGAALGGGLIARDVQTGALRLYFSRPMSRIDYCVGKLAGLMCFFALVTLGPVMLLLLFHAMATGDAMHLALDGPTMPALLAVCALWIGLGGLLIAGLSAVLGSPRLVGLTWLGYLVLGDVLAAQLSRAWPEATWPQWLSMQRVIASLGQRMLLDAGAVEGFEQAPLAYDQIGLWVGCAVILSLGLLWARLSEIRR